MVFFKSKIVIRLSVIFIACVILSMIFVDKSVAYYFHNHWQHTGLYALAGFIGKYTRSRYVGLIPFFCALVACYFLLIKQKEKAKPFAFIALSFYIAYFIVLILKVVLARYRPIYLFNNGLYGFHFFSFQHNLNSFPSGHTVAAAALAIALFYLIEITWLRALFIVYMLIIALSRLIITAHFVSDVLASIYIARLSVMWFDSLMGHARRRHLKNIVDYDL